MKIFVFGSNLAGRHGKGAAKDALMYHGAIYGQAEGLQGNSYAIPTRSRTFQNLPLDVIQMNVERFLEFARHNSHVTFTVTRIGCGLAGYGDFDIAPMFRHAPPNCELPSIWKDIFY